MQPLQSIAQPEPLARASEGGRRLTMAARKSSSSSRTRSRSGSSRKTSAKKSSSRSRSASSRRSAGRSTARKSSTRRSGTSRKSTSRKTSARKSASSNRGRRSGSSNRRYGRKAQEKVGEEMHEFKRGRLRSSSGRKVTNPKQAIAIGLSEARREGGKVPSRRRKAA